MPTDSSTLVTTLRTFDGEITLDAALEERAGYAPAIDLLGQEDQLPGLPRR